MKINRKKLIRRFFLITIIIGSVGLFFIHKVSQSFGFDGIGDFVSTYFKNRDLKAKVTPQEMQIILDDTDYEFLKSKRQEALDRGIQINKGDNYVDCKIVFEGDTTEGEMRLKGHMPDHLEGEKWSFRIKTEDEFMGMYRFSIQDPGTRNYSFEWVYHQLLKEEGIIYLYYDFINVKLNDKTLGIYAMEEHFGQHIPQRNNRPPGVILRWNPGLYWEWRIDELQHLYLNEEYSSFSSSYAEPYDKGKVLDEDKLVHTYKKGAQLLEEFRRGIKSSSEVFDIDKMAAFHAVIDLVGGHHSLDWSDVKLFYNSKTKKLEPVGYESFSVRKSESIAGQRPKDNYAGQEFDYHANLFSDPVFFESYIRAVERICNEAYVDKFSKKIRKELDVKNGVIAHEFPFFKFSFEGYYENISLIKHNLKLPKPLHAFIETSTDTTIDFKVAPVSDFPIEIYGAVIDKDTFLLDPQVLIPAKPRKSYPNYFAFSMIHDKNKVKSAYVLCRIPGSSNSFEVEAAEFPAASFKTPRIENDTSGNKLLRWKDDTTAYFPTEKIELNQQISLAANTYLMLLPGQRLTFKKGGGIYSNGTISINGTEEQPVYLTTKKGTQGIHLSNGDIFVSNAQIGDLEERLIFSDSSNLSFASSVFHDTKSDLITSVESDIKWHNCNFGTIRSIGKIERSNLKMKNCNAINGDTLIIAKGSHLEILKCRFTNFKTAIDLDRISDCTIWKTDFSKNDLIAELNNASMFSVLVGTIKSGNIGVKLDLNSSLPGDSDYRFYRTLTERLKKAVVRKG